MSLVPPAMLRPLCLLPSLELRPATLNHTFPLERGGSLRSNVLKPFLMKRGCCCGRCSAGFAGRPGSIACSTLPSAHSPTLVICHSRVGGGACWLSMVVVMATSDPVVDCFSPACSACCVLCVVCCVLPFKNTASPQNQIQLCKPTCVRSPVGAPNLPNSMCPAGHGWHGVAGGGRW